MRLFFARIALVGLSLSLFPVADAFAHHGGDHPAWEIDEFDERRSFAQGLAHPFTGPDHLVVMLAVGALCFVTRRWETGLVFGVTIGLGALTGSVSHGWVLVATVGMIGVLLLFHRRVPHVVQLFPVAFAGLIHGGAHAVVLSGFGAGTGAGIGLCLGTVLGVLSGVMLARIVSSFQPLAIRFAGASVVAWRTWLAIASVLSI